MHAALNFILMDFKEKKNILAAVLVLIAVFVAVYFYYKSPSAFKRVREDARKSYLAGDKKKVIEILENKIAAAPSKEAEAGAKYMLAGAYVESDIKKAIDIFKEIAADKDYPKIRRARAVTAMANLFMLNARTDGELLKLIFSGEPYSSFVTPDQDLESAVRKLYEYASEIYVIPYSEFRIAEWYAKQAYAIKFYKFPSDKTWEFYSKKSKEHMEKGEKAIIGYISLPNTKLEMGYGDWVRGAGFTMLWKLENKVEYKNLAEDFFKKSMSELREAPFAPELFRTSHELWVNFYYASFLQMAYGKNKSDEIIKLTSRISESKEKFRKKGENFMGIIGYLKKIGNQQSVKGKPKYDYDNAVSLAKLDPNFGRFLKELGWKDADFK